MTLWQIRIREINMENIQIGKVVIVRDSFLTEDERDLKGQKGIVRMLYDADPTDDQTRDEVMVEWTPETLDSFEDDYFYDAFDEEISWTSYILPTEVLEQTDETVDEFELAWKKQEIFTRLFLDGLGRDGKLIVKAFEKPVDPSKYMPLDCWLDYLNHSLKFPVKCKVCFPYDEEDGPMQEYLFHFITYGAYRIISMWVNKEQREAPAEIAHLLMRLIQLE